MTSDELDDLERKYAAATPGEWGACGDKRGGCVCGFVWAGDSIAALTAYKSDDIPELPADQQQANALCIAALHNAAPELFAAASEAERLREQLHEITARTDESLESLRVALGLPDATAADMVAMIGGLRAQIQSLRDFADDCRETPTGRFIARQIDEILETKS